MPPLPLADARQLHSPLPSLPCLSSTPTEQEPAFAHVLLLWHHRRSCESLRCEAWTAPACTSWMCCPTLSRPPKVGAPAQPRCRAACARDAAMPAPLLVLFCAASAKRALGGLGGPPIYPCPAGIEEAKAGRRKVLERMLKRPPKVGCTAPLHGTAPYRRNASALQVMPTLGCGLNQSHMPAHACLLESVYSLSVRRASLQHTRVMSARLPARLPAPPTSRCSEPGRHQRAPCTSRPRRWRRRWRKGARWRRRRRRMAAAWCLPSPLT